MDATIVLLGAEGDGKAVLVELLSRLPNTQSGSVDGAPTVAVATARRGYVFLSPSAASVPEVIGRGVHGAVLVVSLADGPLPDTRKHVEVAKNAGVPIVAVFFGGREDIDVELVDLVKLEISELLAKYEMSSPAMAVGAGGLGVLAAALDAWTPMG